MKKHTRKWRNDFQKNNNYESYYDLFEDFSLIESSFAQQYQIRLRREIQDMSWGAFISYLSGLNGDTPLGIVVRIRSEKDPAIIKKFNEHEKKIRNDWLSKNMNGAKKISKEDYEHVLKHFQEMFKSISKIENKKKGV